MALVRVVLRTGVVFASLTFSRIEQPVLLWAVSIRLVFVLLESE